jgi:DNA-binding transcriptional LysR family regulator
MGDLADSSLMVRRIGQARRRVGTPAYFDRAGEPRIPGELMAHECVNYAKGPGRDVWMFRKNFSEVSVTVSGRLRVSAAEGIRSAVLAGIGLSIVSEWMFSRELASGAVKAVLADWLIKPIDLWAVFPAGRVASAKARSFADFVAERLAADPVSMHIQPSLTRDRRRPAHGPSNIRARNKF